jgi:hypothetical protein
MRTPQTLAVPVLAARTLPRPPHQCAPAQSAGFEWHSATIAPLASVTSFTTVAGWSRAFASYSSYMALFFIALALAAVLLALFISSATSALAVKFR